MKVRTFYLQNYTNYHYTHNSFTLEIHEVVLNQQRH